MRPLLTLVALLIASSFSFAQDMQLRQEAVRLLERAHAVSTAAEWPNLERTDAFRVLDSASGPQEGEFSRVVVQGTGRRDEFRFGDYHVVNVWTRGGLATERTQELAPPEIHTLMSLAPIRLVSFDHEDVIYAINASLQDGRPLRCIEFNTVAGQKTQENEICVDTNNGTLASEKLGDERIEYSAYFPLAEALVPGRIHYSFAGIPKMEVSQTMAELKDATPDVLAAPPNAQIRQMCRSFRRAYGVSMPQPKPGNGGEDTDVVVRGIIGTDGKVRDAVVQSSARPDLNAEALSVIHQWVFTPALCDKQPSDTEASFALHFQAR